MRARNPVVIHYVHDMKRASSHESVEVRAQPLRTGVSCSGKGHLT